jgi:hypothetical protein
MAFHTRVVGLAGAINTYSSIAVAFHTNMAVAHANYASAAAGTTTKNAVSTCGVSAYNPRYILG